MTKYIYIYGTIIILEGIFLIFSRDTSFNFIKLTLGITLIVGSLVAFFAAFSRQRKHVQFVYHEMHALAMLTYGVSILLLGNTFEKLLSFTTFLFIFYSFSEMIFCNWLFNLAQKVVYKIVFVRLILGLVIGIGTVIAVKFTDFTLEIFGVLFIMVGTNVVLYAPVMKGAQFNDISKELSK